MDTIIVVRIPTLLNTATGGANMVPHHILALVLAVADITPFPSSGLGRFNVDRLCELLSRESKNSIAPMAAQSIQSGP